MRLSNIKEALRTLPGGKRVFEYNRKRKITSIITGTIGDYCKRYLKYSISLKQDDETDALRRTIIIDSHVIEKGISHSDFRPGFGRDVVIELQECLQKYTKEKLFDNFVVNNAFGLLQVYHVLNQKNDYDDSAYLHLQDLPETATAHLVPYTLENGANAQNLIGFKNIANARHSVRCYEQNGKEIDGEILQEVISLANTAPSACNRQATHVFAVTNKKLFSKIEEYQKGSKGFGRRASAFLFVTSDLSLYTTDEFKLPIFDVGIYTMNLLYALEYYGLRACTLNAAFSGGGVLKLYAA